ncbi:hypothetical protein A2U01_0092512, partial [Trifolium medium]|nr:hypothetical protein [Trifolium medium]
MSLAQRAGMLDATRSVILLRTFFF